MELSEMGHTEILLSVGVVRATKPLPDLKGFHQAVLVFVFFHKCCLQRMLPVTAGNWAAEMHMAC